MKASYYSKVLKQLQSTGCEVREDLTGCRRRLRAEMYPSNLQEVSSILRVARNLKVKIHPVSCGRNWGFGSQLPTQQDCLVLNLARMNRIRSLDLGHHLVDVEPGVTQGQLAERLQAEGNTHFLNVTGAGLSTSVLGNALERGIGYFGSRDSDLLGLEVMLASGKVISMGYDAENGGSAAPLGPSMEGLFVQSGYGLVTSGVFKLSRKPAAMGAVTLDITDFRSLVAVINRLGNILAEGWIQGVPHLFNRKRLETTFGAVHENWPAWLAVVPIRGPHQVVSGIMSEIKERFEDLARVRHLGMGLEYGDSCTELQAIQPLLEGRPIDLALASMSKTILEEDSGPSGQALFDPEKGNAGLIHVTPSCHLDEVSVTHLLDVVSRVSRMNGYEDLPLSLNIVSPRYACLIISICYKRDSVLQKSSAKKLAEILLAGTVEEGFQPYRLGLEQAEWLSPLAKPLRQMYGEVQRTLDPLELFAHSRYSQLWKSTQKAKGPSTGTDRSLSETRSFLRTIERQQNRSMGKLCSKNDAL